MKTYLIALKRQLVPGVVATIFALAAGIDEDHAVSIAKRYVRDAKIGDVVVVPKSKALPVLGDFEIVDGAPESLLAA